MLALAWQRAREESRGVACAGQLYAIGAALRTYQAVHGVYAPLPDGKGSRNAEVSWRLSILRTPRSELAGYRPSERWDSHANRRFIESVHGRQFSCPEDAFGRSTGRTSYLAVTGTGSLWSEVNSGRVRDPDNEAAGKILLIEVPQATAFWTEPRDLSVHEAISLFELQRRPGRIQRHNGLHYLTADGTVHSLNEVKSAEEFEKMLRAGN